MSHQSLLELLTRLESTRCLVLGDVMLDRFVYGGIARISPEAPIPVLAVERETDMPGGAANVARNLASLGAQSILIGVAGQDEAAELLRLRLAQQAGLQARLVTDPARPTTVKTRFVADGQQMLRADHESSRPLPEEAEKHLLAGLRSALREVDVVILSDYGKGVLCDSVVAEAIGAARLAGKPVITDPKSRSFTKYRGATVLTPNRHELQVACGFECGSDEAVVEGARKILGEGICQTMVVTRGKDGMSVIQRRRRIALQQRKAEYLQKDRIHDIPLLHQFLLAYGEQEPARPVDPRRMFHFREIALHSRCQRLGRGAPAVHGPTECRTVPCLIDPVLLYVEPVVRHLVLYPQQDKHCSSHTNTKTGNIDKRKTFLSHEVAPCNNDKIPDHVVQVIMS